MLMLKLVDELEDSLWLEADWAQATEATPQAATSPAHKACLNLNISQPPPPAASVAVVSQG
jgi:hypothetical protein